MIFSRLPHRVGGSRRRGWRLDSGSSQFSPAQWNLILIDDGEDWAELRRARG
jgi:hypothetical protein